MRDRDLRRWKALVRERANREWRELSLEVVDELACHLAELHAAAIRDGASEGDARQMALDTLNAASFVELSKRPRARRGGGFVDGIWTTSGMFDTLGVAPIVGRTFTGADDRPGGGPDGAVVVVSYAFWQRRCGAAPDVVGRRITLDRIPFTIVGVMPPDFFGPSVGTRADVVIPIGAEPLVRGKESRLGSRDSWWLSVMVRLKPGQSIDEATEAPRGWQPQIPETPLP